MKWIDVNNQLPEKGSYILTDGKSVFYGWVIEKQYYKRPPKDHFKTFSGIRYVSHWMPLPKPPITDKAQNDEQ